MANENTQLWGRKDGGSADAEATEVDEERPAPLGLASPASLRRRLRGKHTQPPGARPTQGLMDGRQQSLRLELTPAGATPSRITNTITITIIINIFIGLEAAVWWLVWVRAACARVRGVV